MPRWFNLTICLVLAYAPTSQAYDLDVWARVLSAHVDTTGNVDYAGIQNKAQDLNEFVSGLAIIGPTATPDRFQNDTERMAYWINAYNALVIYGVVESYPVDSVKDIALFYGFFKRKKFRVDGREMTLDDIEHGILRPKYKDPRIHAAINCAAKSCPRLQREPFYPALLNEQLQTAMQEMVRSHKHVRLDLAQEVLYLSKIFDWFGEDFIKKDQNLGLIDYVARYMDAQMAYLVLSRDFEIEFLDYDWSLNDQKGK